MGAPTKALQKLLCILGAKMQQSKILNLKSQSVLSHPSFNTEPPYTKHLTFYSFLYRIERFLHSLEALGESLKLQNQSHNVWWFNLVCILKCLLTNLSTLLKPNQEEGEEGGGDGGFVSGETL